MFAGYQNIHQNVTPKLNTDFRKSLDLADKEAKVDEKAAKVDKEKTEADKVKARVEKLVKDGKDLEKLYAEASRL